MTGADAVPEPNTTSAERAQKHARLKERERLAALVKGMVSEERFAHINRVVNLATAIARANAFDPADVERVELAALLHDAARDLPDDRLLALVEPTNELESEHPLVLHGYASRVLAESWGVSDELILAAVEGHVFGVSFDDHVGMAVYVADVSEPGRGVNDDVRQLALVDLAAAYRRAVSAKVEYLTAEGLPVHPATLSAYESLSTTHPEAQERQQVERAGADAP